MDKYNAELLIGIIEELTPKLIRNKTEDALSGINIIISNLKEGESKLKIMQRNKVYVDEITKEE